jgi:hypothetical protein
MKTSYHADVIAWANEQAALIRSGKFDQLDLEHIAEEIVDVGKSEQRELGSRMAALLAYLLVWQYQPEQQGKSWQSTIKLQRKRVVCAIAKTPSLKVSLSDQDWLDDAWADASVQAAKETGIEIDVFPETCLWEMDNMLREGWLPKG